jgi:hypothetical protein
VSETTAWKRFTARTIDDDERRDEHVSPLPFRCEERNAW